MKNRRLDDSENEIVRSEFIDQSMDETMDQSINSNPVDDEKLYEKGLNYALYLLSLKMYTVSEVRSKLASKAYPKIVANRIVDYLLECRFLDDLTYTETLIRSKQSRYGAYRMKQMLYRKGILEDLIQTAYNNLEDEGELVSAEETVDEILNKKIANTKIDWDRLKVDYKYKVSIYNKLASFLANRGFSSGVVKTAVSKRLAEQFVDEF